jgi:hypothetical protein
VQPAVLDEEGVAAHRTTMGDQDAFGAGFGDLYVGGDAEGPVVDLGRRGERHR